MSRCLPKWIKREKNMVKRKNRLFSSFRNIDNCDKTYFHKEREDKQTWHWAKIPSQFPGWWLLHSLSVLTGSQSISQQHGKNKRNPCAPGPGEARDGRHSANFSMFLLCLLKPERIFPGFYLQCLCLHFSKSHNSLRKEMETAKGRHQPSMW